MALGLLAVVQNVAGQTSKVIDQHFAAMRNHDVKAITSGYADDAQVYSPNWEGAKTGSAGITEVYSRYFKSTPDLSYKVSQIINAGENIVVEYTVNGTLWDPEGSSPAYMKNKKY
ncbi:MAG: nuclear transport factor 2 family protein, partial [Bacteroidota bacterium]|nr:nuclear transport factor 2 family protein [Bacteroidota bacterium]